MKSFSHHINQTWFRFAFYGVLVIFFLILGIYAALYRISDANKLTEMANQALAGTQRQISFDGDVGRRLTPRPTIILRDVTLTEPDGKTPAAKVGEMRIGVAWGSLLGGVEIEKLVLNDVAAVLSRNDAGTWNFADLLNQSAGNLPVNRAQINNGSVLLHIHNQEIQFNKIFYQHEHNGSDVVYRLTANANHQAWHRFQLQAQGVAKYNEQGDLFLPNVVAKFNGQENNQDFSGSLTTNIIANPKQIVADNSQLIVRSNRFNSHSDVNVQKITQVGNNWRVQNVNSVFTGSQANQQYSGTVAIGDANWQNQQWQSQEITLNFDARDPNFGTTYLALNGSANWQPNHNFVMPNVKITTRQEQAGKVPRLLSEFSGSLNVQDGQNWQTTAQGMFDRQPAQISLVRQNNEISGTVQLAKLNLDTYAEQIQNGAESAYPKWLRDGLIARIDLNISTLNLPTLEVNNIQTTLLADNKKMTFEPLNADLYSGHASGSLVVANQLPLSYTLTQKIQDVQILPLMQDLFRSGSVSGKGDAELLFNTTGSTRQQLTENLSGSLNLNVENGNWHGLNVSELMRNLNNGVAKLKSEEGAATPFSTFVLNATIEKGMSKHSVRSQFVQPAVEMESVGQTNLFNGQINDSVVLYSNNKQNVLPIKLSGTINNPAISLNYEKLTHGLKTPEQKKNAVEHAIKSQWDFLKENSDKNNAVVASAPQPENVLQNVQPQKASEEVQLAPVPKPDLKPEPKQAVKPVLPPATPNSKVDKNDKNRQEKKQVNDKKVAALDKKTDKKQTTDKKPTAADKKQGNDKKSTQPNRDREKEKAKPTTKSTKPVEKEKPKAKTVNKETQSNKSNKKDEPKKSTR